MSIKVRITNSNNYAAEMTYNQFDAIAKYMDYFDLSEDMKFSLGIKEVYVIPNGVDLEKYIPIKKKEALKVTKWDMTKKHVLFAANPERHVKNFMLAKEAFDILIDSNIELHVLNETPNDQMPFYFNTADVVLLTSLWEGSPNVIKEAMACNCPIVSTEVGDVGWLFEDLAGHYKASYDTNNVAEKIHKALEYSREKKKTQGRQRIIDLELDSESISKRLLDVYDKVANKH